MGHLSTNEYWDIEGSGEAGPPLRVWNRKFKVEFDEIVDIPDALNATGVPARWDPHPADAAMLASKAKASHWQSDPFLWLVEVEYSSVTGDEERGADDPRARPLEFETDFVHYQKPCIYDKDGKAVLNSARDPFDPAPTIEDARLVLKFSRYESSLDLTRSLEYRCAVNTDSFFVFSAGEVMCMYIKQKRHFENGIECWHTQYEFQVKEAGTVTSAGASLPYQGWDLVMPQVGFNEYRQLKKRPCVDSYGKEVSAPVRLDNLGLMLPASATVEQTVFKVVQPPYRYRAFSLLALT